MKEQELINDVENLIKSYADNDGNIKHWKARNIADRIVKNSNLQNVIISVCGMKGKGFCPYELENGRCKAKYGDCLNQQTEL